MAKSNSKEKKGSSLLKNVLKKCMFFMDMKRRYKVLSFFALLFVVAYFCTPSMETIVKKLVHQYGSQVTGTDVSIKGFKLSLTNGQATVKGIKIGNPKGYESPYLFNLDEISVSVDLKSLTTDTIVINAINIAGPSIIYEMQSLTKNNVSDILDNIKANTASSEKAPEEKSKPAEKTESKASAKKVIIKKITVNDGEVSMLAGFAGVSKSMTLPLPNITLKNIGEEKKGASISETLSMVISKILDTATQTVSASGLKDLGAASVENIKDAAKNLKSGAGQAADNLKGSIGGLFKK